MFSGRFLLILVSAFSVLTVHEAHAGPVRCPAVVADMSTGVFSSSKNNYQCFKSIGEARAAGFVPESEAQKPCKTKIVKGGGNLKFRLATGPNCRVTVKTSNCGGGYIAVYESRGFAGSYPVAIQPLKTSAELQIIPNANYPFDITLSTEGIGQRCDFEVTNAPL